MRLNKPTWGMFVLIGLEHADPRSGLCEVVGRGDSARSEFSKIMSLCRI